MSKSGSDLKTTEKNTTTQDDTNNVTPLRCLTGALVSAPMAIALYFLTQSIATTFAAKPIVSDSTYVLRIAIAVRTLVVGASALATGIFGLVTFGLIALAIQLSIQNLRKSPS
jgi:hypothetical protein